jgi:hypothetical protein
MVIDFSLFVKPFPDHLFEFVVIHQQNSTENNFTMPRIPDPNLLTIFGLPGRKEHVVVGNHNPLTPA